MDDFIGDYVAYELFEEAFGVQTDVECPNCESALLYDQEREVYLCADCQLIDAGEFHLTVERHLVGIVSDNRSSSGTSGTQRSLSSSCVSTVVNGKPQCRQIRRRRLWTRRCPRH